MKSFGMFAKLPVPGEVKTRLAATDGPEFAVRLYEAFVRDLVERWRTIADRRVLGFAPFTDEAAAWFRELAHGAFELWPQPESSLGCRMSAFFQHVLQMEGDRAVLVGSDSPTLPDEYIERAFEALADHDCVLGPATDGGYFLIGLRYRHEPFDELFSQVEWSTNHVLEMTVQRIQAMKLKLNLLPVWYDVDSSADVQLLRGHLHALAAADEALRLPTVSAVLSGF